jgi:hypothetical protein
MSTKGLKTEYKDMIRKLAELEDVDFIDEDYDLALWNTCKFFAETTPKQFGEIIGKYEHTKKWLTLRSRYEKTYPIFLSVPVAVCYNCKSSFIYMYQANA